jgi:NitT/TauT family transport system substrate-binding protein
MFPKSNSILGLACLAVFLGFGGPAFAQEIRFGYPAADQLHSPALMVMKEKKLLEAAGFTVKWSEFLAGSYAMQDMAAEALDFAACGGAPIMVAHAQGVKLAILAGSNQEGSSLVVNNSIKTVKDLDDKRIGTPGIGSIQDAMAARMAADNDIRVNRKSMKVSEMPRFLQGGEIDGFIAWEPHPASAVAHGFGHELLTSRDMMPGHQCCVLVTRESIVQNNPGTVEKVMKVYLEAYKWFLDNQDESMKMIAKATGISEDVIRQAIKTVEYPYPPYCNVASMHSLAQDLIETDRITNVKATELAHFLESLYHPEFLERISGPGRPNP